MIKKRIISLMALAIVLTATGLFAQGAYVSLNTGYSFSTGSQNIGTTSYINDGSNTNLYKNEDYSFGKGIHYGGAVGYMITKNIGAEIGLSYLTSDNTTFTSSLVNGSTNVKFTSDMLRVIPSIVIASGMEGINPYARFGLIIGSGSIIEHDNLTLNPDNWLQSQKLNGGLAYGLGASVGVLFKLTNKISLFGELSMINMSYAPTKGEITAYSFNGIDRLSSLVNRDRLTDFVESFSENSNQTTAETVPGKSLKQKYPFDSVGLNIGLKYNL